MRTLIVIPIAHTEQALRSLFGEEYDSTESVWHGIRRSIDALALPYEHVSLYQDGLPVCGKEDDIVRNIAAGGSLNHRFLLDMTTQGARLVGTEDPELLLEEYRAMQGGADAGLEEQGRDLDRERQARLAARDRFIAGRINATLANGDVGLLFLESEHAVESLLDPDILAQRLVPLQRCGQGRVSPAAQSQPARA